ncbi:MAG: phosphoglucosamine mutase [Pirellulaceae bacterium]|nr:phosphoglucosamine mutase [Pirellulaceae bacterium]
MAPAKDPIISVSGLRGIVGESLTPDLAVRFVAAYVAEQPAGPLVLSRDGRASGPMLADAVRAAARAMGRDVCDAGIAATPTTGVLVRQLAAAGGIQISASHNPPEYNGLKLFAANGQVLTAEQGQRVLARFRADDYQFARHEQIGGVQTCPDTLSHHLDLVLATVDVPRIRDFSFHVLLDSNHGAGSLLGRVLLERLGCRLTLLGDHPDGQFAHPAEPTAEHLRTIGPEVVRCGAQIGFCQDPDADRLAVIDQTGRYLGEEYTLALCLEHVLGQPASQRATGTGPAVVVNCATSQMCQRIAQRHGARLLRSPVGEAHVVARMQQERAVFGGEGNGGPIDPRVGYVRDSFVGMAQILDLMASRRLPISQLADELPAFGMHKTTVPLELSRTGEAFRMLAERFPDARQDRSDGLRLEWDDRWLLVRASNTEPIVRLIAEAETEAAARELTAAATRLLE